MINVLNFTKICIHIHIHIHIKFKTRVNYLLTQTTVAGVYCLSASVSDG